MKKKSIRKQKPIRPALASANGPTLFKHLASCDTTVRSQSLRLIQSWLSSQPHQLSASEIKKLWKGLFYCIWRVDKTSNPVALIDRLTCLFLSLESSVSVDFFRGFVLTLRREWSGIDRLRLDKFYLLIRRFVMALFELMSLRRWDCEVLGEYVAILEKNGFLAEDKLRGNGVNYHLVTVFLEELKGVNFPVTNEVVDLILRPFLAVLLRGKDRILLEKVKSYFFDELLKMGRGLLEKRMAGLCCHGEDKDLLLGAVSLTMGLSSRLYEVGSSSECVQGNRKVVLTLHEEFLKLEREFELSGVEITIPEFDHSTGSGVDGELPQLIPIDSSSRNGNVESGGPERNEDAHRDGNHVGTNGLKKCTMIETWNNETDKKAKSRKKKKRNDGRGGVSKVQTTAEENEDLTAVKEPMAAASCENGLNDSLESDWNEINTNEPVIANLQKKFDQIAGEACCNSDENAGSFSHHGKKKKRKRTRGADDQQHSYSNGAGSDSAAKTVEKSGKKVRFEIKNNMVWKPHTPLPPESLRLPPSLTPRGSALKKGVPAGPVIEAPPAKKKAKSKKKPQKVLRSATPISKQKRIKRTAPA